MAVTSEKREHERIDLRMSTRIWLDETYRGKQIKFEGFCNTGNLAIGGTFLEASYLLPVGFPVNLEMELPDSGEILRARGEVTHKAGERDGGPGMGIIFVAVDEENRERLLRCFISERIRSFYYERFVVEFPRLRDQLSLQDIALVVNLWEDREGRLAELKGGSLGKNATAPARAALPPAKASLPPARAKASPPARPAPATPRRKR